jgi:hypothetical protein
MPHKVKEGSPDREIRANLQDAHVLPRINPHAWQSGKVRKEQKIKETSKR